MTLRLTSKEGRLNASFTEMEIKPYYIGEAKQQAFFYPKDMEQFESSFQPIQLSEDSEKYILKKYDYALNEIYIELSEKECEVFEVIKDLHNSLRYTYELQMKEQSITPQSEILKSLEGVRVDKLENVFTPQPTYDELKKLGKELLKHQEEMLLYNSLRSSAVPVSEIIKAFDKFGIDLNEKIPF